MELVCLLCRLLLDCCVCRTEPGIQKLSKFQVLTALGDHLGSHSPDGCQRGVCSKLDWRAAGVPVAAFRQLQAGQF